MKSLLFALAALLAVASFADGDGDALVRFLNSRSSQNPKVHAAAAEKVRAAADAGDVLRQYAIAIVAEDAHAPEAAKLSAGKRGEWLENGRAYARDLAERKDDATAWFLLSLERNDAAALEKAAKGGSVPAQNALGMMLVTDALTMPATNAAKAAAMLDRGFGCFKAAAAKKDANGFCNLGMCYMQGYGCQRDPGLAFQCFRTAADDGHPEAINNIGGFYRDGVLGVTNAEMSVRWFKKSAELGNPYGQLNYALALQRGDGVRKDEKASVELLKASADHGCAEAMAAYGVCFHDGRGVKKDVEEAFRWFRRSAEAGFPPAMENLAVCYERGEGTQRDILQSALWKMRFRAALGDPDAQAWVRRQDKERVGAEEKK